MGRRAREGSPPRFLFWGTFPLSRLSTPRAPRQRSARYDRPVRIALIYPPPWKVAEKGAEPFAEDGPPAGYREGDLDADFYQAPYGLFALGAQALRAGHQVKVLNLSAFAWPKVEEIVQKLDADLWGMSCWTA